MKKSDLKTGMTIQIRNENLYRVLKDVQTEAYGHQEYVFVKLKETEFLIGDRYTEDLLTINRHENSYDIICVYDCLFTSNLISSGIGEFLWKRPSSKITTPNESTANLFFPETEKILKKQKEKEYRTISSTNILNPFHKDTINKYVNHELEFEIYKKIPGKTIKEKANSIAQLILEKWGD